jgi:hypothetical protein
LDIAGLSSFTVYYPFGGTNIPVPASRPPDQDSVARIPTVM